MALVNPHLLGEPIRNPNNDNVDGSDSEEMKNGYRPNARRRLFVLDRQRNSWREVIEAVESLLPQEQGLLPCTLLFEMLNSAIILEASSKCKQKLEIRIGKQLDQATVKDLLIPSRFELERDFDKGREGCDDRLRKVAAREEEEEAVGVAGGCEEEVRIEMERMGSKVMELERECDMIRREIQSGCCGRARKEKAGMWREMKRKFGCTTSVINSSSTLGDLEQNLEYDLEEQIENFASTDGTPTESITTPSEHSLVVQEGHNVTVHGQKEASGGPNVDGVAEGNTANPAEQIAPPVTQDLTLEQ
ncbi:hypothetical protein C3L33_05066, partial [Rhododendron williamsianum]